MSVGKFSADLRLENKENQWMGVSVKSQGPGGKIVVSQTKYLNHHSLDPRALVQ